MSRYWKEGFEAQRSDIEDWECPYNASSLATATYRIEWLRGWDEANKREKRAAGR